MKVVMNIDQSGRQGLLIDFRQLNALVRSRKIIHLPRYQEIVATYPSLIARDIDHDYGRKIFFSHRWDDPVDGAPPDPRGWQLDAICAYGDELAETENLPACFWYDFCSLPQKVRTSAEDATFKEGLNHIQRLCRDCVVVALISNATGDPVKNIEQMMGRGWILTELFVASRHERIQLALFEGSDYITFAKVNRPDWHALVPDLLDLMPYDNEEFIYDWLVQCGVACTNGADLLVLAKILHSDLTGVRPGAARPPPLAFDLALEMDDMTIATYAIDKNGISGFFPTTFFETSGGAGKHTVTARVRPPLGKLGQPLQLTGSELEQRRIDQKTGRSPMYPGIVFEVKCLSASPSMFDVKTHLKVRR